MAGPKIEKVADGAFFVSDIRTFSVSVSHYDPRVSNQSLAYGSDEWDDDEKSTPPNEQTPIIP